MSHAIRSPGWLEFLLPTACLGCGAATPRAVLGLCDRCQRRLRPSATLGCRVCGRFLASGATAERCLACLERRPPYERLLSGWLYLPPCDRIVLALKFRGLEYLGEEMARLLAPRFHSELGHCRLVVPVPLHWARRLQRGYNQAERLATPLARLLGLPVATPLRRRRRTAPQTRLDRGHRLHAMSGAFATRHGADLTGTSVLLIDDVATTGATLAAAAGALREAGAARVTALVAARVPALGEAV